MMPTWPRKLIPCGQSSEVDEYEEAIVPGVHNQSDVDVLGRGKLPEQIQCPLLAVKLVEPTTSGDAQHELQVIQYNVLDVIDVHRVVHGVQNLQR